MSAKTVIAAATVAVVGATASISAGSASGNLHFIISADDGTYSGTHEQKYVLEHTKITRNFTAEVPFCQSAFVGTVDTSKSGASKTGSVEAILVTTGIGAVTAALCTQQATQWVQDNYGGGNKNSNPFAAAYFMGTSGWSPFVGGLNPRANPATDGLCGVNSTNGGVNSASAQRVSIGSVCVSPISFDVDCGFQVENPKSEGLDGECHDLGYVNTWDRTEIFGKCAYNSVKAGGTDLAVAIKAATPNPATDLPKMEADLNARVNTWWNANELGKQAPNFQVPTTPMITTRCGEAVSHSIWVGAQMDYQCRLLIGKLLKEADGEQKKNAGDAMDDAAYVCTSAMEGYGFLSALTRAIPSLPAVIIRGASNYDMYPLFKGTTNYWQQNPNYISADDENKFSADGYHYSIQTTNDVLLNYLGTL